MNVYQIHGFGNYCSGMLIILADSEEEAMSIAAQEEGSRGPKYRDPNEVTLLPLTGDGPARVVSQHVHCE